MENIALVYRIPFILLINVEIKTHARVKMSKSLYKFPRKMTVSRSK